MISTKLSGNKHPSSQSLDPYKSSLSKPIRKAYFINSSSPVDFLPTKLQTPDKKALIRKYYPKKITYLASGFKKIPNYIAFCTKGLKHLQAQYPCESKGLSVSLKRLELFTNYGDSKPDPFQFKKAMLSCKRVHALNLKGWFTGEPLKDIIYLRKLQVLNIDLKANQLQDVTKSIMSLELLTRLKVLIAGISKDDLLVREERHFLEFCEKILKKPSLNAFKLVFDTNMSYYSTETFEKMLGYLEKSYIEQWDIQVLLVEDQALRIAQAYNIFKQAQKLAVYSWLQRCCSYGLTPNYLTFDADAEVPEILDKSITIFLTKAPDEIKNYEFDLTSLLRECPKLECLFVDWAYDILSQPTNLDDKFVGYQYLKSIYFNTGICSRTQNWLSLFKIIEDTPFLERLYFNILTMEMQSWHKDTTLKKPLSCIQALIETLHKTKTLKALHFRSSWQSEANLDALQNYFGTLQDLEELTFDVDFDQNLSIPIIPFDKMTKLTQLRLGLSSSLVTHLNSLIASISQLSNLTVLEFRNKKDPAGSMSFLYGNKCQSIPFDSLLSLMDSLKNLTKLQEFIFESTVESNPPAGQNSASNSSSGQNPFEKSSLLSFGKNVSTNFSFGKNSSESNSLFSFGKNDTVAKNFSFGQNLFEKNSLISSGKNDIAEKVELVKQEIKKLATRSQKLEFVQVNFPRKACIEYIK